MGLKGIPAKWGGMEKYVEEIGCRLAERGHEITVFGSRWYCKDYKNDYYKGIRIRRVPTLHSRATDALSCAFMATLSTVFAKYDIVHLHGYASYYFIPLLRAFGKTTVITTHGIESGWENPKYGTIGKNTIARAFKTGINRAHQITTVANYLKTRIAEKFGIDAEVCSSGITNETILPPALITEKYGLKGEDYLLFLGRIDPIKRINWVLEAKTILPAEVKVVIAGGAQDASSGNYLKRLQDAHRNDKRVIFTGSVYGTEKAELLSNCLLFVSPSQDEGLPITLLEACSYGKCSIVTDIDAYREVIENGMNGFLFPVDVKEKFFKTIKNTLQMPIKSIRQIGSKAKKTVDSHFNWDDTVNSYERLYIDLLEKKSRKWLWENID